MSLETLPAYLRDAHIGTTLTVTTFGSNEPAYFYEAERTIIPVVDCETGNLKIYCAYDINTTFDIPFHEFPAGTWFTFNLQPGYWVESA